LIFQAVVTLLIGVVLFLQVVSLDNAKIDELHVSASGINFEDGMSAEDGFIDIKARFQVASYILLVVSLVEILIVARLVD